MKSYRIHEFSDMGQGEDVKYLAMPDLVTDQAIIFHYHIFNTPVQEIPIAPPGEVSNTCYWRVVIFDTPIHSMKDVLTLFEDVVDIYHPGWMEYIELQSYITCEATTCGNCGEVDTVYKMLPCLLCSAPLCPTCYANQEYCNTHLN